MLFLDMNVFEKAGRWLLALLCQAIYPVIAGAFDLFMNVAKINILDNESIKPIYQRVTMILTIVMVFYVTFQFVKYVVQPDAMTDKEKGAGNIVYKLIAVIVLIAFVPQMFGWAYTIQGKILDAGIIEKVILGNHRISGKTMGANFSANILSMFYEADTTFSDNKDDIYKGIVSENLTSLRNENSLDNFTAGLYDTGEIKTSYDPPYDEIEKARINFQGIFAVAIGGVILWMLILYCIDIGTRWAQMLFLQIMAPIAIIGYLSPKKDGIFQKWTKQCLTTYLDLFLRLAIIYFVLLVCEILTEAYGTKSLFTGLGEVGLFMEIFIYIALIMGLLVFAKKAPKMLSELFPKGGAASGTFGLNSKDRGFAPSRIIGAVAGTAIGAGAGLATGIGQGVRRWKSLDSSAGLGRKIGAGVWGATKGAIGGTIGGATRGLTSGAKKGNVLKNSVAGAQKQMQVNQRFGNREENGYGFVDQMGDRARGFVGARSRVDMLENEKGPLKRRQETYSQQSKINDQIRDHAFKKAKDSGLNSYARYAAFEGRLKRLQEDKDLIASLGGETSQAYQDEIAKTTKGMKKAKDEAINEYVDSKKKVVGKDKDGNDIYDYNDGNLANLFANRDSLIKAHNDNNSKDNQIDTVVEIEVNGVKITKRIADMNAEEFDEYIKQVAKKEEGAISRQIGEITQEQEKIKRQTAGSGINDGKK